MVAQPLMMLSFRPQDHSMPPIIIAMTLASAWRCVQACFSVMAENAGTSSAPTEDDQATSGTGASDAIVQYVVLRRDLWREQAWPLGSIIAQVPQLLYADSRVQLAPRLLSLATHLEFALCFVHSQKRYRDGIKLVHCVQCSRVLSIGPASSLLCSDVNPQATQSPLAVIAEIRQEAGHRMSAHSGAAGL